jgi:type IV secretion system protein VirB9
MKQCKPHILVLAVCVFPVSGCSTLWNSDWNYAYEFSSVDREVDPPVAKTPIPPLKSKQMKLPERTTDPAQEENPQEALEAIQESNEEATNRSSADDFVLSTQFYDYLPGQIYEVVASPVFITTLALKPGEQLTSIAAGDTSRWEVSQTTTGTRPAQTLVLVKPLRPWIQTNLVLTTNQRVYQVGLKSVPEGVYNATVAWRYPNESMLRFVAPDHSATPKVEDSLAPVQLDQADFNYRVKLLEGRWMPGWAPIHVFNDGNKTYIQFPRGNKVSPLLYAKGLHGLRILVNYRVRDDFYILDKVVNRMVLLLGGTAVGIERIAR